MNANTAARLWMLLPMALLLLGSAGTRASGGDGVPAVYAGGIGSGAVTAAEPWTGHAVLPVVVNVPVLEDVRVSGAQSGRKREQAATSAWSQESSFVSTSMRSGTPAAYRHLLQVYRI